MLRLFNAQNQLIEDLQKDDGKSKCVIVVSHALILGWITNIHEILSVGQSNKNDSYVTNEDYREF